MSVDVDDLNSPAGGAVEATGRPVIVTTRGLPGSGKTTWALAELARLRAAGVRAARVSRDDVRATLGLVPGRTTAAEEAEVTAVHHRLIGGLIEAGVLVVLVDDTNLDDAHLAAIAGLATTVAADMKVHDLRDVPVEVCIDRDATRAGIAQLGGDRIRSIAAAAGLTAPGDEPAGAGRRRAASVTAEQMCDWLADAPGAEHGREPGTDEGFSHLAVYDETTWHALAAHLADQVNTALADASGEQAARVLFRGGEELAEAFTGPHTTSSWLLVSRQGRVWSLYVSVDDEFYLRAVVDRFDMEGVSVGEPRVESYPVEKLPAWEWPLALVDDAVDGAAAEARRDWHARVEGLPRQTVAAMAAADRIDDAPPGDGEDVA